MSLSANLGATPPRRDLVRALAIAAAALILVLGVLYLLALLSGAGGPPTPPPRAPFGASPREAAPSGERSLHG